MDPSQPLGIMKDLRIHLANTYMFFYLLKFRISLDFSYLQIATTSIILYPYSIFLSEFEVLIFFAHFCSNDSILVYG